MLNIWNDNNFSIVAFDKNWNRLRFSNTLIQTQLLSFFWDHWPKNNNDNYNIKPPMAYYSFGSLILRSFKFSKSFTLYQKIIKKIHSYNFKYIFLNYINIKKNYIKFIFATILRYNRENAYSIKITKNLGMPLQD